MPGAWLTGGFLNESLTTILNARGDSGAASDAGAFMGFIDFARAVMGLAITLGLIGLAAYAVRRYAPGLMERFQGKRGERRMQVVETLVLDPARRLVLVRVDGEERLILLGEGREMIEPRGDGAVR